MDKDLNRKYLNKIIELKKYYEVNEGGYAEPHCSADSILCDLLKELGYDEIVEIFKSLDRYYE